MTPEEFKSSLEQIQKTADEANVKATELQAQLEAKNTEIANLDASVKEQNEVIAQLKKSAEQQTMNPLGAALAEKKSEIETKMQSGANRFSVELKVANNIGTGSITNNQSLSVALDPTIAAAPIAPNAFLAAFGVAPATADELSWVEASKQNGADYVDELASNTKKSDVTFTQVKRQFGKLAHFMVISTEFADWYQQLYNFVTAEAPKMIDAKFDAELCSGAGSSSTPKKVYGIKGNSTAWAALGTVASPTIADVIANGVAQIAKEGFTANVAFVTFEEEFLLRTIKDSTGNYIYDPAKGYLGQVRIMPTSRLSAGEIIVADTNCYKPYAGGSFELEMVRDADIDAWKVYARRRVQAKGTTPAKKGLVYAASLNTAIAALTASA